MNPISFIFKFIGYSCIIIGNTLIYGGFFLFGIGISFTLIGAIIGIPLCLWSAKKWIESMNKLFPANEVKKEVNSEIN